MRAGRCSTDVIEAGDGQREVTAALVASEGVNLVDDDGADVAQRLAAAGGGEHEVERLRRRDQDVRRVLDEAPGGLSAAYRRCAGRHGYEARFFAVGETRPHLQI